MWSLLFTDKASNVTQTRGDMAKHFTAAVETLAVKCLAMSNKGEL